MTLPQLSSQPDPVNEEWRPVPEWEGLYEVSDQGRVRSLVDTRQWVRLVPLIKAATPHHTGYLVVTLYSRPRKRQYRIHNLMLRAFVGSPSEGYEGAHEDGNPHNNILTNLSWKTRLENSQDRDRHGRTPKGSGVRLARLNEADIPSIRIALSQGESRASIARRYGVTGGTIESIRSQRTWRHVV